MKCFQCFSKSSSDSELNRNKDTRSSPKVEPTGKEVRVLLLGPGSGGKTTLIKQIKKIHHCDESREQLDRELSAKFIKEALIGNMKILCDESIRLHDKYNLDTLVDSDNEYLRSEISSLQIPYTLTPDIAFKVRVLWSDEGIRNTLSHRQYFQIMENAAYFFDLIDTICEPTYVPSFDDFIRFRQITTGLSQTKIKISFGSGYGDQIFHFVDVGGQRSQRKKIPFASEDANAVIFVVGISDYDLTLFEDNNTNRLQESIELFREIMIDHRLYEDRTIFIFFNKYDLFKEKIEKIPITAAFDDFPTNLNANDESDVIPFVGAKFLKVFQDAKVPLNGPLHIIRTTALDTDMVETVFSDVTLDLVKRNLERFNIL